MQIGIQEAKAPWVQFERRAVEDRNASIEAGHYVAKDVDFVMITPYGSKDMIDRVAAEWFEAMAKEVEQQRYPQEWHFAAQLAGDQPLAAPELPGPPHPDRRTARRRE
jgi:hypothetical protein